GDEDDEAGDEPTGSAGRLLVDLLDLGAGIDGGRAGGDGHGGGRRRGGDHRGRRRERTRSGREDRLALAEAAEVGPEVLGRRVAGARVLLEELHHDRLDGGGDARVDLAGRLRRLLDLLVRDGDRR